VFWDISPLANCVALFKSMPKLKHRKLIFLLMIALLAGGSMTVYAESPANFWMKTIALIVFQQAATVVIYLSCFGWELIHSSQAVYDCQSEPRNQTSEEE